MARHGGITPVQFGQMLWPEIQYFYDRIAEDEQIRAQQNAQNNANMEAMIQFFKSVK